MKKITSQLMTLLKTRHLGGDYYSWLLETTKGPLKCQAGQFVHLKLPGAETFLRRAMSVAGTNADHKAIEIIFKVFGRGTRLMAGMSRGTQIDLVGPLGQPFERPRKMEVCLMIGGGVGFPPLLFLATQLVEAGRDPATIQFFYGGRSADEIVERSRIKKLGVKFHPVTDDGSFGQKGMVTGAVAAWRESFPLMKARIFSCGPEGMLKAVDAFGLSTGLPGQVSLEAHMPCGFGVCLGCVVPLRAGGDARVCVEGPIFQIGEVLL